MRAVIIEDEIIAAKALQTLVEDLYKDIEIIEVLQSIEDSVRWFKDNAMPDLAFVDIHLADGSSFLIFEEVEITCPVIFTTAYDEYALKAFEVNSIDYLLKPIDKNALDRAVAKYKNLSGKTNPGDAQLIRKFIDEIKATKQPYKQHFLVQERDRLIPLTIDQIAYIYIETKIVKAITLEEKVYYLDGTLDDIMSQLNSAVFFRANRQYIVSHKAIKDLSVWFGNKLSVNLKVSVPERILISKARVREFKDWLGG